MLDALEILQRSINTVALIYMAYAAGRLVQRVANIERRLDAGQVQYVP